MNGASCERMLFGLSSVVVSSRRLVIGIKKKERKRTLGSTRGTL